MPHLDEGTIHAWLDGALTAEEQVLAEAHAAECKSCAASVGEARGLVAASSRILSALDDVPAGVVPATTRNPGELAPGAVLRGSRARRWVTSPAIRIAAALLLVATGTIFITSGERARRAVSVSADQPASLETRGAPGAPSSPLEREVLADASPPAATPSPKSASTRARVRERVVATNQAKSSAAAVADSSLVDALHIDTALVAARAVSPPGVAAGKEASQSAAPQSPGRLAIAGGAANRRKTPPAIGRAGSITDMSAQDANRAAALAPSALREERDGSVARAIAGCYAIRLGAWTPALDLGEDTIYVTPPRSIVLDALPTVSPNFSGFRVTPVLDTPGRDYASWEPLPDSGLRILWTTGFSGVRMQLKLENGTLGGIATTFWDFDRMSQQAEVKGDRVSCQ